MELEGVLGRYPGKITVMGNVPVDLLGRGTVEQVVRETKRLLLTVSAVGPHIMASGNTIASAVKPENYAAMVRTTLEYGQYPIDTKRIQAELSEK